ncbi:MAG TPA: 3-dehydroquinate synthase [Kofleriaceae bacterium]
MLFLIGFMAAGKSTVGRETASRTGRSFVDLDDEIALMGEPVPALVKRDEAEFRRRESAALASVIARGQDIVVATGGGAAAHGDNVDRMRAAGTVIALDVDVATAQKRAVGSERPLLANGAALAKARAPFYRRAHAVVATDDKTIAYVVDEVLTVEKVAKQWSGATVLGLGARSYAIPVETSVFDPLTLAPALGLATKVAIITDTNVAKHWLPALKRVLPLAEVLEIAPGEGSKSFATYERVCSELIAKGLDRGSAIVALGGGVVGDLAGFVAATLFRGIPVVQIPTTLVAMTDAAIGGKTAVDLPAGKNLVGAFWQPRLVACGLETLTTLPARERRAGFGELWKYALLDGAHMWTAVDACAEWAAGAEGTAAPLALTEVIQRAVAYKAAVVGRDELERTGVRALLNLGHTIGHAIETASSLTDAPLLHGECVGLGLLAACRISAAVVGTRTSLEGEVRDALQRSGLPTDIDRWLRDDVLERVGVDKKRIGKSVKFIVAREVGQCEPLAIDITDVRRILRANPAG